MGSCVLKVIENRAASYLVCSQNLESD